MIKNIFTSPDDDKKTPPHVGEVMDLWVYLTALKEIDNIVQVGMNTTTDVELLEVLRMCLDDCDKQVDEIIEFFQKEGVPLPPTTESKPKSNPEAVPMGVKLTDTEIVNLVSVKTAAGIISCAVGISEAIRNDVGALWMKFFMKKVEFGAYLKPIMKKRGWIMYPPLFNAPGMPDHK
jgi:hypothetical protein